MSNLFVSDADIASYLASEWGMPARYAEISTTLTNKDGLLAANFTWHSPGFQASSATTSQIDYAAGHLPGLTRLVWFNSTTLWYTDHEDTALTNWFTGLVQAELNAPMIYHEVAGVPTYVSDGVVVRDMDFSEPFQRYGDFECGPP